MNKTDLKKIRKVFKKYIGVLNTPQDVNWYIHKKEDFKILIYETGEVFQIETEIQTQVVYVLGIELKTYDNFKKRFKSFTGVHV